MIIPGGCHPPGTALICTEALNDSHRGRTHLGVAPRLANFRLRWLGDPYSRRHTLQGDQKDLDGVAGYCDVAGGQHGEA